MALECIAFFEDLIERSRQDRRDDLISHLLQMVDDGMPISAEKVAATCMILHLGGYETTMNLIGNGMYLLSQNPHAYDELRADPSLVAGAVEEMLRCEGSARRVSRFMPSDTEVGGVPMPAGSDVVCLLGALDRDPARFDDPHTFDIHREQNPHLAFGLGIHFCLGAALARLEAQEASAF